MLTLFMIEMVLRMVIAFDVYICMLGIKITGTVPVYSMTCDNCNNLTRGHVASVVILTHAMHRCDDNLI